MMAPNGAEIYIAIFIFIILTDFVTFINFVFGHNQESYQKYRE